jgi:hypothetical protein
MKRRRINEKELKRTISLLFLIVLFLMSYSLYFEIKNLCKDINRITILKNSLRLPIICLISIIFNKNLSYKPLLNFVMVILLLETSISFINNKQFLNYNFILGTLLGLSLSILIIFLIRRTKKANICNLK